MDVRQLRSKPNPDPIAAGRENNPLASLHLHGIGSGHTRNQLRAQNDQSNERDSRREGQDTLNQHNESRLSQAD